MHRHTLGPMSSNDVVRRMTMATGRSRSESQDVSKRRASSFHSSVHGSKREDPRPLKDGVWKKEKAQTVVDFVKDKGWPIDRNIDIRLLCHCPPNSEVLFLLQFLINLFDPEFRLESLDGDAVTNVFKRVLRYPYSIPVAKKLVQITPLTWPAVFGAVVWLVEKLQTDFKRREADEAQNGVDSPYNFYFWVSQMYQKALWGVDDWRLPELELRQGMERQVSDLNMDNSRLEVMKEQLKADLEDIMNRPDDLHNAHKQRDTLNQDLQNFTTFVGKMAEYNHAKAKAIEDEERVTVELEKDVARLEQQKAHVQHMLQTQELSKDEEEKLKRDKMICNAQLVDLSSRLKATERGVRQVEEQFKFMMDKLEETVAEFNHNATLLQCYPGGKHNYGSDQKLEVIMNASQTSITQDVHLLNLDPKTVIKPALERLESRYIQKNEAASERLRVCKHESKQLEAERYEQSSTLEGLRDEVAAMEKNYRQAEELHLSSQKLMEEIACKQQKYQREKNLLCAAVSEGINSLLSYKDLIGHKLDIIARDCEARVGS